MIFLWIFLIFGIIFYHYWVNRRLYTLSKQFRQEFALPFIGNTYYFLCKDEDILNKIGNFIKRGHGNFHKPKAFWLGQRLALFFTNPDDIEKILSSQKLAHKSIFYDFLKNHAGEGLVTGSGPYYKKHRRAIAPLFDSNFNNKCYDTFEKYLDSCMEDMKNYCGKNTFNISGILRGCFSKFIGRVILGIHFDLAADRHFTEDIEELYFLAFSRLTRPWLHSDFIYKFTSCYRAEEIGRLRSAAFIQKAINKSRQRITAGDVTDNEIDAIVDQLGRILQGKPELMDEKVFHDHIYTLFLASEDTITMSTAICCLMLGMYTEYQIKVAEELRDYFGIVPRNARLEDIGHLPYLDMCVKETLRIQPIAPMITRKTVEECSIDAWTIPTDTEIVVPVFYIHRDPKFWENPDHFHPDHFLPENDRRRPTYAYIPFSAGIRGCIGRVLANAYIRIFLATFLQKFEVEADGKLPDIKFRMDISTRPVQGYNVRIKERIWQ